MTWRLADRLMARKYSDKSEQLAYRWAYYHGYFGHAKLDLFDHGRPNAYGAGYWDGWADGDNPEHPEEPK